MITAKHFSSDTTAELEGSDWRVISRMVEKRKIDSGDWEERVLEAMAIHKDLDKAVQVAMNSVMQQFNDVAKKNRNQSLFEGK
jgi:hypothetical protein